MSLSLILNLILTLVILAIVVAGIYFAATSKKDMDSVDEVLMLVAQRPKSLSAYYYGKNRRNMKKFLNSISFGGGCINDCIMHLCSPHLPFGGVGSSGMGAYHGKASFYTFTHCKSILVQTTLFNFPLRFPPFGVLKRFIIKLVTKSI